MNKLLEFKPKAFKRYYEPFIGGGALLLELLPSHATINDSNKELIYIYKCLRNKKLFKEFVRICKLHEEKHNEDYYYQIRDLDRKKRAYSQLSIPEKAARCLYLNKACFNGLYRVSNKGFFNVPSAKREKVKCFDDENISKLHKYFVKNRPIILSGDFSSAVKTAREGDFVYFDPPYDVVGEQSFTSYTANGFGKDEQIRLRDLINELTAKGVLVMTSNANTPFIQEIYNGFNIHIINAKRMINSNGDGRGDVEEVIITNY
ncbi:MAG: Dam family site-specific DNA-(adenine-N6)-methyltransferase [Bacilli bacterium]|nr:Dam family site-specific DNA-(adenine-N6)-methyltransferase [Bacilli bacterium]